MKIKVLVLSLLASVALFANAQKGLDNPMTRAVLKVYSDQLKQNPTDWETWMHRAYEYYNHYAYSQALNDVDNALRYIPESKKSERCDAYLLRANIYEQTDRLNEALSDLNSALALNPDMYVAIYQRANIEYELGNYSDAKVDYRKIQRVNPRSAEALIGLARIAVKENNLGTANELLDQAVNIDPNNSEYYVRRARVRRSMGNDRDAVDDLILALSTDSRNVNATQELVDMANSNYAAVVAGLTSAIQKAPKVGMYVYIRARIAQAHHRYKAALEDFQRILKEQLYDYHGIYASMAECQFALGRFSEALDNVERAIAKDSNTVGHYVLRSRILRALNRNDEALQAALKASVVNPGNDEALAELGLCRAVLDQWNEAANLFGEASINNPQVPAYYLLRAWALASHCNQPVAAKQFCELAADLDNFSAGNVNSLRGFALLFAERHAEGLLWIENILESSTDSDGYINYLAACFYSAAGDQQRALDCVAKSLEAGYANYYDWMYNSDGRINVALLRDNATFQELINNHKSLF